MFDLELHASILTLLSSQTMFFSLIQGRVNALGKDQ